MAMFDWFKKRETQDTESKSKQKVQRPYSRNMTEEMTVNGDLTRGLYHNQYPGLKLAGSLAYSPIAVPVAFMGLPVPVSSDENTQEALKLLVQQFSQTMQQIHLQAHREGTVWVFPFWNSKAGRLVWELIPDDTVSDVIRDIDTGEIIQVITTEQIKVQTGENTQAIVGRKRYWTRDRLRVEYTGAKVETRITPNRFGILPIPFSNNADGDEIRGHSDYERILSDLKNYHDIDNAWTQLLAKFSVKMIQEVSTTVDQWASENAIDLANFDVSTVDVIFNKYNQEKTTFVFPQGAHDAYDKKLNQVFYKLVEGSGIPEIAWGLKTEGNHASAEEQMGLLIKFVEGKREQKNGPYDQLFEASLTLLGAATMQNFQPVERLDWNNLDAVSEGVKSQIFQRFADGVSKLVSSAGASQEQIHALWKAAYPRATDADFEKWKSSMSTAAKFTQFSKASFLDALQATGAEQ